MQRCLAESMRAMELGSAPGSAPGSASGSASGSAPGSATRYYQLVCARGIGVTETIVRMCASPDQGSGVVGGSLVVFPHVLAEQIKDALRRADPAGLGTTLVTNATELGACASLARRRKSGEAPPGVVHAVTDTFFRKMIDRLEDINHDLLAPPGARLFWRAAFDDARSLVIPSCSAPIASVVWTVVGPDAPSSWLAGARQGQDRSKGFLGRRLTVPADPAAGATVWCDGVAVSTDPELVPKMFGRDSGPSAADVDRSLVPWRPSGVVDTARIVADSSHHDPIGTSALVGTLGSFAAAWPSFRGWREGGDRSCPICLCEPAESLDDSGGTAVLRVRTVCCGREFCAGCFAKSLVSRADRGLAPSCPHCRDTLGACLETCEPVIVTRDASTGELATSAPGPGGRLAGVKTFDETVALAITEALEDGEARVLVVAPPASSGFSRTDWFSRACGGFEVLSGSSSRVSKALERYRTGLSRVMVVESGPLKELGVRMPWVTHVLMIDCFEKSTHWLMRTAASPIEKTLQSAGGGGSRRLPIGAASRSRSPHGAASRSGSPIGAASRSRSPHGAASRSGSPLGAASRSGSPLGAARGSGIVKVRRPVQVRRLVPARYMLRAPPPPPPRI